MSKSHIRHLLLAGCVAGAWTHSPACDLCSIYSAQQAQGANGRGFFAGVSEQFTRFNTLQSDGHTVANDGEYVNSLSSQVFVGYNLNSRVGIQFNLPFLYREYGSAAGGSHNVGGLGDVSLLGNVRLYEHISDNFTFTWRALAGVKFPTGATSHLNPNEPDFATGIGGHDLTLGSGSFDGVVGTGFYARYKRVFLTGNAQYALRSEGAHEYQFANDWMWSGGPGLYLLLGQKATLALQALVSGESKALDTAQGMAVDDTGTTVVYLGPQVNFTWGSHLSAQVGADLPVSIESTGDQLVPNYRVRAAVTWHF